MVYQFVSQKKENVINASHENIGSSKYEAIITFYEWIKKRERKKSIALIVLNLFYGISYSICFHFINMDENGDCYATEYSITPLFSKPTKIKLLHEDINFSDGQSISDFSNDNQYQNVS